MRTSVFAGACLLLLACGGCRVGPDFVPPPPPDLARYGEGPDPVRLAAPNGETQRLAFGADLPQAWWHLFRSPRLDRLVREGLSASPGLAQVEAVLRQAVTLTDAARAALLPGLAVGLSRNGGGPVRSAAGTYGLYGTSLALTYDLDLFGGTRRGIEAQAALEAAAAERLRAAELALGGAIVAAAIQEAGLSAQVAISEAILRRYRELRDLVRVRHEAGAEPIANLLSQESLIRSQEGTLVSLRAARAQTRHRLAVLVGRAPAVYGERGFRLEELPLPRRIPVALPARLVAQRPDIRAAEAVLRASSAQIGVATADLLPQVTLTADLGASAATLAALGASSAWAGAAALAQPLFDGGAREARRQAAVEGYAAAQADYRATVLAALQNVADALSTLEADAGVLTAAVQTEDLARRALDASEVQYRAGGVPYASLLLTQAQYATASLTRLSAQIQRLTDTAALVLALGGGWDDKM